MLIVKCRCGFSYTVSEKTAGSVEQIHCPECNLKVSVKDSTTFTDLIHRLSEISFEIQQVPNNTKTAVF